jgi:hypothetical protein
MAKKATTKNGGKSKAGKGGSKAVVRASSGGGRSDNQDGFDAGDAFVKLLQSPLVAELVAVAATAALASLAEHGIASGGGGSRGKRAGKAVKEAGKAAAAAVGRRLGNEIDEIRKASGAKADAKA